VFWPSTDVIGEARQRGNDWVILLVYLNA